MNTDGIVIWGSAKYFPIHYGGFSEGRMLVKGQYDGKYYIMIDSKYTPAEPEEETISGYGYENIKYDNTNFEIALKIDSPYALVNNQKLMIDPSDERVCAFVENGRTLLPMRFIAENLPGYSVEWDYLTSSALVQSDYISILLAPDISHAQIIRYMPEMRTYENHRKALDQPPVNSYDRLFLPVRALCEMIGVNVFYDERGLVVLSNKRTTLEYNDAANILNMFENEEGI